MTSTSEKFFRQRRLCYWDAEKRLVASWKANFEKKLQFLPEIVFYTLKSLDDDEFHPCDLLVIAAMTVPEDEIGGWLLKLQERIQQQGKIWSPAIILTEVGFSDLSAWLHPFSKSNWYFDLIHPEQLESLPIRVANLLRMHDHLHELQRYHEELATMQSQIVRVEEQLKSLQQK